MAKTFNLTKNLNKLLISGALLLPSIGLAAGSATVDLDGSTASIHWQDAQNVRFNMPDSEGYLLTKGNKTYIVSQEGGELMVMDIAGMAQMAMAFAEEDAMDQLIPESITKVKATGKKEKIAGIKGELYILTVKEKDGDEEEMEIVLTDNKTSNELTEVYISVIQNMLGIDNLRKTFDQLPKNKRGVLRIDDEFKLVSLSKKAPDSDYLELPGKPLNMQDLMQDLQKALESME